MTRWKIMFSGVGGVLEDKEDDDHERRLAVKGEGCCQNIFADKSVHSKFIDILAEHSVFS